MASGTHLVIFSLLQHLISRSTFRENTVAKKRVSAKTDA